MAAEACLKLLIFHYVIVLLAINLPSECDGRVYLPRFSLIIQNQNFIFFKNPGHLAQNLHYILKHLKFSEAVAQ